MWNFAWQDIFPKKGQGVTLAEGKENPADYQANVWLRFIQLYMIWVKLTAQKYVMTTYTNNNISLYFSCEEQ